MRSIMTFLLGVLFGAGALFLILRAVPDDPAPVVAAAPPPGVSGVTGVPASQIEGQLPGAPLVEADLSTLDLPLRPSQDLPAADAPPSPADAAAAAAGTGKLLVPVQGIKTAGLTDTYDQPRGKQRQHEALDIMAAKGTPVLAVADGKIEKLFQSKPGGTTLYQFDPSGRYAYYYAHLDRYADGIKEGMELKRGQLLGYVGVTGNSDPNAPHLHFAMFELTPEKQWWKGTPVNPYPLMADTVTP
ncbi:M23 family metallopeptidase [Massilia sp. G4R7]|uniref:M23 family metallopeptidase n=1 Tax=Massilia phyllostachyos TaxID=2898585 RepID=A0ABS8Q399_9BURK|nr:M23 family metallopeptidase [Massilia phyllostachyos]MCD2516218.1 M23 family metallopeptidase [Massilia phyllostachyos]